MLSLFLPQTTTLHILDATGRPAVGAIVTPVVASEKGRDTAPSLTAGPDGTVTLPASDKMISLIVRIPGKALDWVDFYDAPPPKEIRLSPATHLKVKFLDDKGQPVTGATIVPKTFMRVTDDGPGASFATLNLALSEALSVKTGADGTAEFDGFPQGALVRLDLDDERFAHPEDNVTLDKTAITEAKPIRLSLGAVVTGRVVRSGQGVAGIKVAAQGQRAGGWAEALSDAEGRYRLTGLSAGMYNVALDLGMNAEETARAVADLPLTPGQKVADQNFTLEPGTIIEGRVVDTAGKPQPKALIGVYGPAHPQSSGWVQNTVTDADGRFRLRVPAGQQYVYTMDRNPQVHADVTTKPGTVTTANLTVRVPIAPLIGKIVDPQGNPVAGAKIDVDFDRNDETHRYMDGLAVSKADGSFELPGDLKFPLTIRARKGDLATPGGVRIADKASLTAQLSANNLRAVTGTIVDEAGKPIPNAEVHVVGWNSAGLGRSGLAYKTDAQGRFRAEGLWPDQEVNLDAIAEGFGLKQTAQTPLKGETTDFGEVRLPKADSFVGGRIEDENGKPLAGVEVNLGNSFEKQAHTDEQGHFRVEGVPKGTMRVSVQGNGAYLNRSIETGRADHVLVLKRPPATPAGALPAHRVTPLAIGKPAPELKVDTWLNAKPTTLAALRGQVVVLDFWAIWCGPCREELPNVVKLAQRLKGKKATVIGVHDSSTWKRELTAFAKKNGLAYALAVDKTAPRGFGQTGEGYGVGAIPTMIVIDPQGKVAYNGFDRREAERVVDRLLKK